MHNLYIYTLSLMPFKSKSMQQFNKNWEFILLNVGYFEHYADWNWENIHRYSISLYCVKERHIIAETGDKKYELKPNNLYLTLSYKKMLPQKSTFDKYAFLVEGKFANLYYFLIKKLLQINSGRQLRHFILNCMTMNLPLVDMLPKTIKFHRIQELKHKEFYINSHQNY